MSHISTPFTGTSSYLEFSQNSQASPPAMEKSEFKLIGLNQAKPSKISMVKHRRHLAPNEDTKSRIFGDIGASSSASSSNGNSKFENGANVFDQENTKPSSSTSGNDYDSQATKNSSSDVDGISHPRFPRGGNRRNAHTPF